MAAINGSDLMLFTDIDGEMTAIAYATSHTLNLNGDEEEVSSKDSGKWKESEITRLGWSATSENLIGGIGATDALSILIGKWIARESIDVHLTLASEAGTADGAPLAGWTPDLTKGYKGTANIVSVTANAPDKQKATMTINLTGTGPLTKASV